MLSLKLSQLGVLAHQGEVNCFENILKAITSNDTYLPSNYYRALWEKYVNSPDFGHYDDAIFKSLILSIMVIDNIKEIHLQATLFPYLNIEHDCILYSKERGPIILNFSFKTIKRHNFFALQASILKQAYPHARSFLITMDEREAAVINTKIKTGQILGLDNVIVANQSSFDDLIKELKSYTLYKPDPVNVLTSARFIFGSFE